MTRSSLDDFSPVFEPLLLPFLLDGPFPPPMGFFFFMIEPAFFPFKLFVSLPTLPFPLPASLPFSCERSPQFGIVPPFFFAGRFCLFRV